MGWLRSGTALLNFDQVRVSVANLIGEAGKGFKMIMNNFNAERITLASIARDSSQCCYDEALAWAQQRKESDRALVEHQVIKHKLIDMRMHIESTRAWLNNVVAG